MAATFGRRSPTVNRSESHADGEPGAFARSDEIDLGLVLGRLLIRAALGARAARRHDGGLVEEEEEESHDADGGPRAARDEGGDAEVVALLDRIVVIVELLLGDPDRLL